MKAKNYKILLKALGWGLLTVLGIVVIGAMFKVLILFGEQYLGKWGVIALAVAIPVAVLTAVIYHMLNEIDRNEEEE